eukprot:TRINITY_DN11690_c0_g1_i1.p1 TRINITY_DN11690_c0_g1~~TRINITY_DN11690_c0_g1_i1.p1  ORF type:complete len:392 (+),score=45.33 TRINITY_DN11690_c0_g1_i1:61-1236(+)
MRCMFLIVVLALACRAEDEHACVSDDFSVRFPAPPSFTVSKANGSCSCPGGFVGSGAFLTELWKTPVVAAVNISHRIKLSSLDSAVSANAVALARLQLSAQAANATVRAALAVNDGGVFNSNCLVNSDCLLGLLCSATSLRCVYAGGHSCTVNMHCAVSCTAGVCTCQLSEVYRSCRHAREVGCRNSGTFTLDPDGAGPMPAFLAYCDLGSVVDGGGWTAVWSTVSSALNDVPWTTVQQNAGGNPFSSKYHLSLAQIQSISHTEHVVYRSSSQWLRVGGKFFSTSQWPSHQHEPVVITSADGSTASAYLSHSNICNSAGGWYAVSNGEPDHHNGCGGQNYMELNSGCNNDYVYVYRDAQFMAAKALGTGWNTSLTCCMTEACNLAVVILVR